MKIIDGIDIEIICNEYNIIVFNFWVIIYCVRKVLVDCLEINWFK